MSTSVEDGIIIELDGDEIVVWKNGFLIALRNLIIAASLSAQLLPTSLKPLAEFGL